MKHITLLVLSLFAAVTLHAQSRSNYSIVQAGALIGLDNQVGEAQSGYQFQFVFGKNYYDKTFLGLGIANEVYRAKPLPSNTSGTSGKLNTLPIFVDFRQELTSVNAFGNLGLMANAGYAPGLGGNYYKGAMAKAGLTYSHLLADGSDLQFSVGYGLQQFDNRFIQKSYTKSLVFITVGLFTY